MSTNATSRTVLLTIAPALLVVTAGAQRYLAEAKHLNPWKGGGFGMFAAIPQAYRVLEIQPIDTQSIGYRTTHPRGYRERIKKLQSWPTEERLQAFADELANRSWILIGLDLEEAKQFPILAEEAFKHAQSRSLGLKGVRIILHQYDWHPETSELWKSLLFTVDGVRRKQ